MKKVLRVDPQGFAEIRRRLLASEMVYGVDAAPSETLRDFGVVVPEYVTEVAIIVQLGRPPLLMLEDA